MLTCLFKERHALKDTQRAFSVSSIVFILTQIWMAGKIKMLFEHNQTDFQCNFTSIYRIKYYIKSQLSTFMSSFPLIGVATSETISLDTLGGVKL